VPFTPDIHQAHVDWRSAIFPRAPGRKFVGKVLKIGGEVKEWKLTTPSASIVSSIPTVNARPVFGGNSTRITAEGASGCQMRCGRGADAFIATRDADRAPVASQPRR
jgi:hypothetical protein